VRNHQSNRTLQTQLTGASAAEVLAAAREFFGGQSGIYAAFVEKEGPTWMSLRGQGGEEIVIGTAVEPGGTSVSASSYLFDAQVAQFLSTLPPAPSSSAVTAGSST